MVAADFLRDPWPVLWRNCEFPATRPSSEAGVGICKDENRFRNMHVVIARSVRKISQQNKQTNKQTNRQTDRQTNKQTNNKTSNQTNTQTNPPTTINTNTTKQQSNKQTPKQSSNQASKPRKPSKPSKPSTNKATTHRNTQSSKQTACTTQHNTTQMITTQA